MIRVVQEYSLALLSGVCAALVWANLAPDSYVAMTHHIHFAVNDVFMVLFFAIATGEIVESCLPGGALNPPRKAINPLFATLGGVAGPALAFLAWATFTNDPEIRAGWGIPTATDIALAWLIARAVFGRKHPAVSYLLLLAIADDAIGLAIIAVFYPDPSHPVAPLYLLLVAAGVLGAWYLRRKKVNNFWIYIIGPGLMSWLGLRMAGVHPALALVFVVPFMPAADHDEGLFAGEEQSMGDTLNRFQHTFQLPVDLGLFAFGLANAGVVFSSLGNATWAVVFALIVGKTVGIFAAAMLAHSMGFRLPERVTPAVLALIGFIASLGLTVALFVAGVAYADPEITAAAKMGALFSIGVAPVALVLGRLALRKPTTETSAATATATPNVGGGSSAVPASS